MTKLTVKTLLVIAVLFVFGCNQAHKDISQTNKFAHMIGESYQIRGGLLLYALSDNKHAEDMALTNYAIVSPRGLGRAETVWKKELSNTTVIIIKKVVQCSNCIFGAPVYIQVSIEGEELEPKIPVYIYMLRIEQEDGKIDLDPQFFKKME